MVDGQLTEIKELVGNGFPPTTEIHRCRELVWRLHLPRTDFFNEYRWERERSRSRQASYLEEVLVLLTPPFNLLAGGDGGKALAPNPTKPYKETGVGKPNQSQGTSGCGQVLTADSANIVVDGQWMGAGGSNRRGSQPAGWGNPGENHDH